MTEEVKDQEKPKIQVMSAKLQNGLSIIGEFYADEEDYISLKDVIALSQQIMMGEGGTFSVVYIPYLYYPMNLNTIVDFHKADLTFYSFADDYYDLYYKLHIDMLVTAELEKRKQVVDSVMTGEFQRRLEGEPDPVEFELEEPEDLEDSHTPSRTLH